MKNSFSYVDLLAPRKTIPMVLPDFDKSGVATREVGYVPASIGITVYLYPAPEPASTYIDEVIEGGKKWPSFELLERSLVSVAGFSAEQVVYIDTLLPFPSGSGEDQPLQITRAVYFNDGNSLWIIESKSEVGMADQVKADYEHILQTFKILKSAHTSPLP